jgi:hypothetical protein
MEKQTCALIYIRQEQQQFDNQIKTHKILEKYFNLIDELNGCRKRGGLNYFLMLISFNKLFYSSCLFPLIENHLGLIIFY